MRFVLAGCDGERQGVFALKASLSTIASRWLGSIEWRQRVLCLCNKAHLQRKRRQRVILVLPAMQGGSKPRTLDCNQPTGTKPEEQTVLGTCCRAV